MCTHNTQCHTCIVAEERHSDSNAIIDVKFPVTTSKKLLTNNGGSLEAIGKNNKGQVRRLSVL